MWDTDVFSMLHPDMGGKSDVQAWQISQHQTVQWSQKMFLWTWPELSGTGRTVGRTGHTGEGGESHLLAELSPIACVRYYNYLNLDYEVMTSRQHISYKILFGARGLEKFPASRQIEAHNYDDLWHSLTSQATNNQNIWPRIRTSQSKLNNFFGKFQSSESLCVCVYCCCSCFSIYLIYS